MFRNGVAALLAALAGSTAASGDARVASATFPGAVKQVASPAGVMVTYVDLGLNADKETDYRLLLRYPDGRKRTIHEFNRNVDVTWSPRGDRLALTDWAGSNVAECFVVTTAASRALKLNITPLVVRATRRVARVDLTRGDHVYVTCSRWRGPDELEVEAHGDRFPQVGGPGRLFRYRFIYDAPTGRVRPME